jgi:GDPmannose 4,6-dehydratase
MWMILQQPTPGDYVVATGTMRSIRDLCEVAFSHVGLNYRKYVRTSDEFKRPLEVEKLCGDASRMRALGWVPHISFETMIREMVDVALEQ